MTLCLLAGITNRLTERLIQTWQIIATDYLLNNGRRRMTKTTVPLVTLLACVLLMVQAGDKGPCDIFL